MPENQPQPSSPQSDEQDISLSKLSQAYAGLMSNTPEAPEAEESPRQQQEPAGILPTPQATSEEAEQLDVSPRSILEAILFVGTPDNSPLGSKQIAARLRGVSPREIDDLVRDLNRDYDSEECPYKILHEGSGYRMVLREQFSALRDKFHGRVRQSRLSQAAIDVLAIVAYNQPTTREKVEKIREMPSSSLLTQLVRRELLRFDRSQEKPRTRLYFTTDRFLQLFGLSSLDDLPQSQELDTL